MLIGYFKLMRIAERKRRHDEQPDPRAEVKKRKSDKGGAPPPATPREVIDLTVDPSVLCVCYSWINIRLTHCSRSVPQPGAVVPSQTTGKPSGKQPRKFSYTFTIPPVGPWPSSPGPAQSLSERRTFDPQSMITVPPILPHAMLPNSPPDIPMFNATDQSDVMDLTTL